VDIRIEHQHGEGESVKKEWQVRYIPNIFAIVFLNSGAIEIDDYSTFEVALLWALEFYLYR
jgi:hypothetical protein